MTRADKAEVAWGGHERKNGWVIRIQVGAEVIKRHPDRALARDADEAAIRSMAVRTAADEGYELDPTAVTIMK